MMQRTSPLVHARGNSLDVPFGTSREDGVDPERGRLMGSVQSLAMEHT